MKYVFICGGSISGIGKGTIISSVGVLLSNCGWRITHIKIDPYLNIDAGTMSPFEHGEVFVLDDGGEADLDLGGYERFSGLKLTSNHSITTGKVYSQVLQAERRGDYLGKTVQVVPHVTGKVLQLIQETAKIPVSPEGDEPEICLVEIGGTVGEIESAVYFESLRELICSQGQENVCTMFVSYVPLIHGKEQKSKPTQHGVRDLRMVGLSPDIIISRCAVMPTPEIRNKIAFFANIQTENAVGLPNLDNLFRVPDCLGQQNVHNLIAKKLHLESRTPKLEKWNSLASWVSRCAQDGEEIKIAVVSKYYKAGTEDSYLSVLKALTHAVLHSDLRSNVCWVDATHLEEISALQAQKHELKENEQKKLDQWKEFLSTIDGIVVPGGFGNRGVEGKIHAAQIARERKIPYLGLCLGMQVAVIEYARHVAGLSNAGSTEFDEKCPEPVVIYMPEISKDKMGGTLRCGSRTTILRENSLASRVYAGAKKIHERHRHRYEVNPKYVEQLEKKGLHFSGKDESGDRMEIIELSKDDHPFFMASQFHPEFLTAPFKPAPLFYAFVQACKHSPLMYSS